MAGLKTALFLALLLTLFYQQVAAVCPSCPKECCFAVRKGRPLRANIMASYYRTTSDCYLNALVLVLKSGKRICVNPKSPWVKGVIGRLPEKK
ncbi:eotaxin-like [Anolis carolinensis]|uniref:eotaxin-like n=1 Tax=Anolis carolinensis TaxID=28377 RepID=UPI002F2B4EE8